MWEDWIMKVERYIKELLGIVSEVQNIKYSKTNLEKHLIKRNHIDVLKYFDKIEEIINNGSSTNSVGESNLTPN